jgi:hypothetical protein
MNELSEAVKLSRDAESEEPIPFPVVHVYILVDECSRTITLVQANTMVHSGGVSFEVVTDGWEFADPGVKFTQADAPFDQYSETSQRIVFFDEYVQNDPTYAGSFDYTVTVQKSNLAPFSIITRLFSTQQIDKFDLVSLKAPFLLASVFSTSGVVVNQ